MAEGGSSVGTLIVKNPGPGDSAEKTSENGLNATKGELRGI